MVPKALVCKPARLITVESSPVAILNAFENVAGCQHFETFDVLDHYMVDPLPREIERQQRRLRNYEAY